MDFLSSEQAAKYEQEAALRDEEREMRVREAEAYEIGEKRFREAQAAQRKIEAEGEAAAIFARPEAEARGNYEIPAKKAEGLKRIVDSRGGSQEAFQMMLPEHLEQLSETAAKAISNIKFDKVVVWDSGADGKGGNATSNFLKGLGNTLSPMLSIMKDVGGVEMPEFIGRLVSDDKSKPAEPDQAESKKPEPPKK